MILPIGHRYLFYSVFLALVPIGAFAQGSNVNILKSSRRYQLPGDGQAPVIQVSEDDYAGVRRVANDLAQDFGRVLGANGTVQVINATGVREAVPVTDKRAAIITGTIGHSLLIDSLIQRNKLDVSEIKGKWESYISQMVKNPLDGLNWALVIAGSDKRGTIYGLYDVSEQLGVSPWYWWADVPPKPKTSVWLGTDTKIQGPPSIIVDK